MILWGLLITVATPALQYLAAIDWTTIVSPTFAGIVIGLITILLRLVTNGPAGKL